MWYIISKFFWHSWKYEHNKLHVFTKLKGHIGALSVNFSAWSVPFGGSWDYGTFHPPYTHFSNAHAQPFSGATCLIFGRTLCLLIHFMCANSKGSGNADSPEPSLFAYVISTIIAWAGSCVVSIKLKTSSLCMFHYSVIMWATNFQICISIQKIFDVFLLGKIIIRNHQNITYLWHLGGDALYISSIRSCHWQKLKCSPVSSYFILRNRGSICFTTKLPVVLNFGKKIFCQFLDNLK